MTTPIVPSISDEQLAELVRECRTGADEHGGMGHDYDSCLFDRLGNALEQMQARLRAAEAGDWLPIESAPLDGSEILLMRGDRVTSGAWIEWVFTAPEYHSSTGVYLGQSEQDSGASWASWDGGFTEEEPPTHWRRLPKPKAMEPKP